MSNSKPKQRGLAESLAEESARSPFRESAAPRDVPERIGRFVVRRFLGAGTFGKVYQAYDPVLEREVALKVPHTGTLNTPRRIERFLGDAKAPARLRHPHIVRVYDVGQQGDCYFIASDYIAGTTLAEAVEKGELNLRRSVQIVRALAEALAYAHQQGIIHRDVKPANVMLDAQGQPHLIDFGLARRQERTETCGEEPASPSPIPQSARRTMVGAVLGTAAYMSPEQAAGHSGDARPAFDQYSLGVILYELLCGCRPFSGPAPIVIFHQVHTDPPPPRRVYSKLPLDLEAICLKALAKRPEDRYPSCRELADDLRRWLEGEAIGARRMGGGERFVRWCRREPGLAIVSSIAVLALLAVAALAIVFALHSSRSATAYQQKSDDAQTAAEDAKEQRQKADRKTRLAESATRNAEEALQKESAARRRADNEKRTAEAEHRKADEALRATDAARLELSTANERMKQDLYFSRIALARQALEDRQVALADAKLEECEPKERGRWEWMYLKRRCRELLRQTGRGEQPTCIALSPDGRWLVWAKPSSTGPVVVLRELAMNKTRPTTKAAPSPIRCLAFSMDNKKLALGCANGQLLIWDVPTCENTFSVKAHTDAGVQTVAFRSDGKQLLSGGVDRTVKIWNPANGNQPLVRTFEEHRAALRSAVYRPDGKQVASCGLDHR